MKLPNCVQAIPEFQNDDAGLLILPYLGRYLTQVNYNRYLLLSHAAYRVCGCGL